MLGVGLAIGATLMFACGDIVNKHLLATYDVPLVAAMRYLVHTVMMVAILGPVQGRKLTHTVRTGLVVVRSVCLAVATLFIGLAVQLMPIAETVAIVYLSPIIVVLMARPLLGEAIGPLGWLGALGGFVGVLLIVRPGGGLDPMGVVYALCNVGVTVTYYLLSRILARTETTMALLFSSALVGTLFFGVVVPWFWFDATPSILDLVLFASFGILAFIGHYCFTAAYRHAPASVLAPISYTHLIWAALLGWSVFGQLPDALGLTGIAVITLAGVLVGLRSFLRPTPASQG
jgi:drug/metabolite transporter (DMT)-like permease